MSKENKPEDLEKTIRLDTKEIADPYDNPTPPSVDSIEDILHDTHDSSNNSFDTSEDISLSPQENFDSHKTDEEVIELGDAFEFNILEAETPKDDITTTAIETKIAGDPSHTPEHEDFPNEQAITNNEATKENDDTLSTDDKKEKTPVTASETATHTSKPSSGISFAMLSISLVALVAGFSSAWISMSSQSQIDSLSSQLNTLQNSRLNNLPEFVTMQNELATLKQEFAALQLKPQTPTLTSQKENTDVVAVKEVLPITITPSNSLHENKPTHNNKTWNVIISSHDSMKKAKQEQHRENIRDMQTSIVAAVVKGKNWYRIVAQGFTTKKQAIDFTHKLKKQGITDAWIQHNK